MRFFADVSRRRFLFSGTENRLVNYPLSTGGFFFSNYSTIKMYRAYGGVAIPQSIPTKSYRLRKNVIRDQVQIFQRTSFTGHFGDFVCTPLEKRRSYNNTPTSCKRSSHRTDSVFQISPAREKKNKNSAIRFRWRFDFFFNFSFFAHISMTAK